MIKGIAALLVGIMSLSLSGCDVIIEVFAPPTKVIVTLPDSEISSDLFQITLGKYASNSDLGSIIRNEFGTDYRLADWNDIRRFKEDILNWVQSVGISFGERYLISWEGVRNHPRYIKGQYYFVRGKDPEWEGARRAPTEDGWDDITSFTVTLYSRNPTWMAQILAVHKSFPDPF